MAKAIKNISKEAAGEATPSPAAPRYRYVGPFYTKHIVLGNGDTVKPFHETLTDGGVEAFIAKYPERAGWFTLVEE